MNKSPAKVSMLSPEVETQREYYANTADDYDQMHLTDEEHNIALEWAYSVMQRLQLSSILDVGCGTGRGVKFFHIRGIEVKGIEPVQELLDAGYKKHGISEEQMIRGSGEALPFEDDSFDATIELGVLHHVAHPEKMVAEMIRVSRRVIFISDSNRFGQGHFLWRLLKIIAWKLRLWWLLDLVRTKGRGYTISKEDGLAYSYSVYDSFDQLSAWADRVYVVPTSKMTVRSWLHPIATCSHALLIAERDS